MPIYQAPADTKRFGFGAHARLRRLWPRVVEMYRTHEARQDLCAFDDRVLQDFGATRLDARNEARRRFWNLPPMA